MKATDIPSKIDTPFAASAGGSYKRVIPDTTATAGAASWTDGFPPVCFEQIALGGVPPSGADFNGVLNMISALSRWFISGAPVLYDATFQAAIGGYPQGAIVQHASSEEQLWVSTADDNTNALSAGGGTSWSKLVDWLGITTAYTAAIADALATPASVPGAAKAWLQYNGSTGATVASLNVASVVKNYLGDYTINFTTAFASSAFVAVPAILMQNPGVYDLYGITQTAGSLRLQFYWIDGSGGYNAEDVTFSVACFGN